MDKRFWVWLTSVPSLVSDSEVTNEEQLLLENKVKTVQRKALINNVKTGETTKAYQNITTYPDGSMGILQKNLTTGEISFQGINSSGQRVFETSLTPYEANTLIGANSSSKMLVGNGAVSQSVISKVSYQTGNNSLVLYDKTPVPVTNGTLVAPLTTNRALATVPLLTDGAVSQVASKLPYNPVLKSPVKYPNLTDSENKFLNDYMNKEMPGKIVSKYNDVNKYEYNATTNPGPLAIGDDPQINNFYGGRYNKRILEKPEVYFRAGDSGYEKEFGSYYRKDFPKSSIQVRTDSAVKLYWTDEDGVLTGTSPLNRVYMIEFPAGTEIYEGPIGYQEGRYLGGLENEQIYIEKAWKKGALKSSFPLERKKELVLPSEENMK